MEIILVWLETARESLFPIPPRAAGEAYCMNRCKWIIMITVVGLIIVGLLIFRDYLSEIVRWPTTRDETAKIPRPQLEPLPQHRHIRGMFNGSRASVYHDPYRHIWRYGDDLEQSLCDLVRSEQYSIDLAVQELNLPRLAKEIRNKHQAGIPVRIILENRYSHIPSKITRGEKRRLSEYARRKHEEFIQLADIDGNGDISIDEALKRDAILLLRSSRVPIIDDTADGSKGSGTMHHKFMIIDGCVVVCGSANFTMSGFHGDFANPLTRGNSNHLLIIESEPLARIFQEEFEIMWGDGPAGEPDSRFGVKKPHRGPVTVFVDRCPVTVQFSPSSARIPWEQTSNGLIKRTCAAAGKSIDLAQFVFSAQEIVDAVSDACMKHPNLRLRGIFDASFATRYYSETLDMWQMALMEKGRYEISAETGAENRPWKLERGTIGLAILPEGDKMHHKFAVIDSHVVITGSHNWSAAANTNNDEFVVVIESDTLAAHFLREMDRLTSSMHVGPTRKLVGRVQSRGGTLPPVDRFPRKR